MRQYLTRLMALSFINSVVSVCLPFLAGWLYTVFALTDTHAQLTAQGLYTMLYFNALAVIFTLPVAGIALLLLDKSGWRARHKYLKVSVSLWLIFGILLSAPGALFPIYVNLLWCFMSGTLVGHLFTVTSRKYNWP